MTDRDSSREAEKRVRHQHSASSDQSSRALVPMWDSSDPDRAPPPLPLNPQSPSFTSRAGTSSAIQSAHAVLTERARESAALVPALARRMNEGSPDRALVKGASHRRMQSLQPGSVRDLSFMIEGSRNTPPSPSRPFEKQDRPSTPTQNIPRDGGFESRSHDKAPDGSIPMPGPSLAPIVRPAVRRPAPQSILGENTPPPSSTMLALHTMGTNSPSSREADPALSNITNGPSAAKGPISLEGLSSQILCLTNIAQSLQKELGQLSRRSRDNATDLLSLKEATTTRDEDIRRSLRDLMGNRSQASSRISSREHYGGLFLDNKPHCASPPNGRPFQLPRLPSPKSCVDSLDRASISTPSLSGVDSSACLALLDKILRGLGTKDGQESLVSLLNQLSEKLSGLATAAKVEELAQCVRDQSESAIVPDVVARGRPLSSEHDVRELASQTADLTLPNGESRRSSAPPGRGAELLNEDLIKIIRSVKDSVAQGGGLTAEVKALVRELRGEVLGMGRELGKRLEKMGAKAIEESEPPSKDDVSRVIDEGLEQMKEQLNHVLREHRRQSQASVSSQKNLVDYQEIYNAMRAALRDNEASGGEMPDLSREDVIEAVRDAWENYKPEIEVQQIGLEREEVLTCLKEGLQEYMPRDEKPTGATRDEVFKAVVEGLKHFVPPQMHTMATMSRDEIIEAVRDCLEEFEFPVAASAIGRDMSHMDMVHAVKEGLEGLQLPQVDALVARPNNDEVLARLQDLMGYLKVEFRAVSEEAKENVAANGRDTEQVLDATKDGLENLRVAIESYVDRVTGASGQEEFMRSLSQTMEELKEELVHVVSQANDSSREQLQTELEGLREVVNSSMVPAAPQGTGNNQEVLEALHNGLSSLRQEFLRPRPETSEILDAIQDGVNDLRAGIDRVTHKPVDLTANDEILDALRSGLDSVRSDIEALREDDNVKAVAAVATVSNGASEQALVPADTARQDDVKKLEVLITQLRIKIDAMESARESESVQREDMARFEDMLRSLREAVNDIASRERPAAAAAEEARDAPPANANAATREDVDAIETILRNTKARLDDLIEGEQAVRKEHLDTVEALVFETRETLGSMSDQLASSAQKEDLAGLEALLGQLSNGLNEMKEHTEREAANDDKVTKTDVEAVETVVLEIKTALDVLVGIDFAALSRKEDIASLETLVREVTGKLEAHSETSFKALDDRQAEIVGVADRVTEVKTFLEEFQETVKGKLQEGSSGVEAVSKLLETMGEKIVKNENVGQDLKEMFDTMKAQFEESKEVVAGARLESNEKLQEAAESIGTKIDDKITELVAKYDEFKAAMDEKTAAGEARDMETEAAVVGTKAVAEELKLLIDTLGSTVTDSLEKMEEASKTVFTKVEELASRAEETHNEGKTEHEQTRDQMQQAAAAFEELQGEVKEYQPKILEAVKDILLLVGEHYEHSKTLATELQDRIVESKPAEQPALPPPEKYDDSEVQGKLDRLAEQKYDDTELQEKLNKLIEGRYDDGELQEKLNKLIEERYDDSELQEKLSKLLEDKYDDSEVREKLDWLAEQKYDDTEVREKLDWLAEQKYDDSEVQEKLDWLVEQKYDDTGVHEKLDKLMDHSADAAQAFARLQTLDEVRQSVVVTAAEMSQFLSHQTQRIADEHEDREKTLQETIVALERKLVEKGHVEASIVNLRDEEARLRGSVAKLRTEQEKLVRQRTRLTGDVSSLETAMRLRKEALFDMEHRAERLERRILEAVMDHSRVLLMAKGGKDGDKMSRKRVKKPASEQTEQAKARPAVGIALAARRNLAAATQKGTERRIASLSQMNGARASGLVKRSQSVRTPMGGGALRKRSWGGGLAKGFGDDDKENAGVRETVEEVEEEEEETEPVPVPASPDGGAEEEAALVAAGGKGSEDMPDSGSDYGSDDGSNDGSDDGAGAGSDDAGDSGSERGSGSDGDDGNDSDGGRSGTETLRRSSLGTTVESSSTGPFAGSEAGDGEHDGAESEHENNGLVLYGQ